MELTEFLEQNGWTRLQSNLGVAHQAWFKSGWICNIVRNYVSVRRFDRTVLATDKPEMVLGFLQERNIQ